jgi:hypothetical protein
MHHSPFVHQQNVRSPTDLRVDAHGKDEGVVFTVTPLELFSPLSFDVVGIHESLLVSTLSNRQQKNRKKVLTLFGLSGMYCRAGQSSNAQEAVVLR